MLAVHNTAPFKIVRAAAPYFRVKDGESRVIINISSTSGINGNALVISLHISKGFPIQIANEIHRGQANYAVAKAGVVGLTVCLSIHTPPLVKMRALL